MTRRSIRKRRHLPKPRFVMTLGGEEVLTGMAEVRWRTPRKKLRKPTCFVGMMDCAIAGSPQVTMRTGPDGRGVIDVTFPPGYEPDAESMLDDYDRDEEPPCQ